LTGGLALTELVPAVTVLGQREGTPDQEKSVHPVKVIGLVSGFGRFSQHTTQILNGLSTK
jgi:hypothetical protein